MTIFGPNDIAIGTVNEVINAYTQEQFKEMALRHTVVGAAISISDIVQAGCFERVTAAGTRIAVRYNATSDEVDVNGIIVNDFGIQGELRCNPNVLYDPNSTVEILTYSFVCAEAKDRAGNVVKLEQFVGEIDDSDNGGGGILEPIDDDNDDGGSDFDDGSQDGGDDDGSLVDDDDGQDDSDDFIDPPILLPPETGDSGGFPYVLVLAIVLLFACIGGGGYYAYRKGYLDDQLKKFGIKSPRQRERDKAVASFGDVSSGMSGLGGSTISSGSGSSAARAPIGVSKDALGAAQDGKQSSYDHHLNRLNSFIDIPTVL